MPDCYRANCSSYVAHQRLGVYSSWLHLRLAPRDADVWEVMSEAEGTGHRDPLRICARHRMRRHAVKCTTQRSNYQAGPGCQPLGPPVLDPNARAAESKSGAAKSHADGTGIQ